MSPIGQVGIVIIGLDEGERLRRCIDSVAQPPRCTVYVDSGSGDGSAELARARGIEVLEVGESTPARSRNAGFRQLLRMDPNLVAVFFVDGDCELVSGWLERACVVLEAREDVAIVCGRLRERSPEASIYNRFCDLEWDRTIGEVGSCGGIFLTRASAFAKVGGFDESIPAGEEPELCLRLHSKGWRVVRTDDDMALHDSAMLHFSQWWRRQIRSGYGALDVWSRYGVVHFRDDVRSARIWGLGWPLVTLSGSLLMGGIWGWRAAALFASLAGLALLVQAVRIALRSLSGGQPPVSALAYGGATVAGKFGQLAGQARCLRDRRRERTALVDRGATSPDPPRFDP